MQKEKNFMLIVGISEGRRKEIENKQKNRASNGDHQHNKNNNITDTPELNNCLVYSPIFCKNLTIVYSIVLNRPVQYLDA